MWDEIPSVHVFRASMASSCALTQLVSQWTQCDSSLSSRSSAILGSGKMGEFNGFHQKPEEKPWDFTQNPVEKCWEVMLK